MKKRKKKWHRCLCSFLLMLSFLCTIGGSAERVSADEAMMSTSGYFYIKIVGADGDVTLQRVNVTYAKSHHEEIQDVKFSLPNKSKNNPHNLKISGLKTERSGTYSETKQGKTAYASKSEGYNHVTNMMNPDCPVQLKA